MSGSHLIGTFLEMMSAERGAAKNTIDAYRRDLSDYSGFVAGRKQTLLDCPRETVNAYLDQLRRDGLSASSSARRLSAIRQFHRFLCADAIRTDDPTRIVASPKARRALPKVLSIAEVDKLLATAEAEAGLEVGRRGERPYHRALVISLLNPKAILFFVAFFVQFVDPTYAHPAVSFLALGTLATLASAAYLTMLIFVGTRLADAFRRRKGLSATATSAVGAVFVGFAVKLALASA